MLDLIEKLINEHGSSTILRERLELISDRYNFLEEKNSLLSSKNSDLESKLEVAKKEISRLNEILKEQSSTHEKLADIELKVLQFMFDSNNEHQVGQIASLLESDVSTAQYYLNELKDRKYIINFLNSTTPTTYKISKHGIKYIVESTDT